MSNISTRRQRRLRTAAAVTAVLALGATAAGCGSTSSTKSDKLSIQFVSPLPSFPTFKTLGDCMKKEADKRGASFTVSGPTGQAPDPTTMIAQIQQATVAKKGAIVTVPLSPGFAPVLQQAQKKGIHTVTLLGTGGKGSGADLNLGYDWNAIGQQYVDAISKLPGQQNLGLVAAATTGTGKQWIDGVTAAAAKTSNVKIVGTVYTGDDATKALPEVNALLAAHPDVNMIATHMGTVTPGAVAAIKAKNLTGKVNLLVNGSDNGGTQALSDGIAKLMFVQDVCGSATKGIDAIMDLAAHKKVPAISFGTAVIEQPQVTSYLSKGWS
ncbi:MAG: ribose transporter, periplasmic binding protein [Marmoricola sp.]|nr:ribose transporter, periplasmic binding protein [Marmoricola sp.]